MPAERNRSDDRVLNSLRVNHFSVSEVAQFSVSLDTCGLPREKLFPLGLFLGGGQLVIGEDACFHPSNPVLNCDHSAIAARDDGVF
jgi:hypothetical protein